MRSKLPDWEGGEKACTRAIEEYDKTIATYPESGSSGGHLASNVRFSMAMARNWLALAYANKTSRSPLATMLSNTQRSCPTLSNWRE
jgi:hypothetical protein